MASIDFLCPACRIDSSDLGFGDLGRYRDVALNIQLITPLTRALAIQRHVCELQLLLVGTYPSSLLLHHL